MVAFKNCRQRKVIRMQGFDYSSPGYYYVTLLAYKRLCLFGKIINKKVMLNDIGLVVFNEIKTISNRYKNVSVDSFVVMPNHLHAIFLLEPHAQKNISIPKLIQHIKTYTTNAYIKCINNYDPSIYASHLWHRGYYENVVRDKNSLPIIRKYIHDNPANWDADIQNRDT